MLKKSDINKLTQELYFEINDDKLIINLIEKIAKLEVTLNEQNFFQLAKTFLPISSPRVINCATLRRDIIETKKEPLKINDVIIKG